MNPSDITPEIIATKIREWRWDQKLDCWVSPEGHRFFDVTFKEPEWTGPLLAKAAEIGEPDIYKSGEMWFSKIWDFDRSLQIAKSAFEHKELNYAIAGAILEAKEK